jgi:hypothetical protein
MKTLKVVIDRTSKPLQLPLPSVRWLRKRAGRTCLVPLKLPRFNSGEQRHQILLLIPLTRQPHQFIEALSLLNHPIWVTRNRNRNHWLLKYCKGMDTQRLTVPGLIPGKKKKETQFWGGVQLTPCYTKWENAINTICWRGNPPNFKDFACTAAFFNVLTRLLPSVKANNDSKALGKKDRLESLKWGATSATTTEESPLGVPISTDPFTTEAPAPRSPLAMLDLLFLNFQCLSNRNGSSRGF